MARTTANTLQAAVQKKPAWQDNFQSCAIRVGFGLTLTRAMCEYLSAVADGVHWDRIKYGSAQAYPDNFLATSAALYKRGLITQKPQSAVAAHRKAESAKPFDDQKLWEWTTWDLTPAGRHVVELLKLCGLFVEADSALEKNSRAMKSGAA